MTIKGLRDGLIQDLAENAYQSYWFGLEGTKMLCTALDKQIPKKPEMKYTQLTSRWCYCGTYLGFKWDEFKYCPTCGQAIDWSEDRGGDEHE